MACAAATVTSHADLASSGDEVLVKCKELEPSVLVSTESTKPRQDFTWFSLETDGQDGPTDMCGAVGHPSLILWKVLMLRTT